VAAFFLLNSPNGRLQIYPSAVGDLQGAVSAHSADLAPFGANYHPRNPRATALYAVIEDHLEEFIRVYDEKYQKKFGFWRPVV
jgi:hypothetical protein